MQDRETSEGFCQVVVIVQDNPMLVGFTIGQTDTKQSRPMMVSSEKVCHRAPDGCETAGHFVSPDDGPGAGAGSGPHTRIETGIPDAAFLEVRGEIALLVRKPGLRER